MNFSNCRLKFELNDQKKAISDLSNLITITTNSLTQQKNNNSNNNNNTNSIEKWNEVSEMWRYLGIWEKLRGDLKKAKDCFKKSVKCNEQNRISWKQWSRGNNEKRSLPHGARIFAIIIRGILSGF